MTIYVQSCLAGQATPYITTFADKAELIKHGMWLLEGFDKNVNYSDTIETVLDKLFDHHIATSGGSVSHQRLTKKDALRLLNSGDCIHV